MPAYTTSRLIFRLHLLLHLCLLRVMWTNFMVLCNFCRWPHSVLKIAIWLSWEQHDDEWIIILWVTCIWKLVQSTRDTWRQSGNEKLTVDWKPYLWDLRLWLVQKMCLVSSAATGGRIMCTIQRRELNRTHIYLSDVWEALHLWWAGMIGFYPFVLFQWKLSVDVNFSHFYQTAGTG